MNALKIIITSTLLLMGLFYLQGANPTTDKTNEKVIKMVERINEFVKLDTTQQTILNEKANNCFIKKETARKFQHKKLILQHLKTASDDFRASLDSILTPAQKEQLALKKTLNNVAIEEKNKDKKVK
jgi:hypothetical protein